MKKIVGNLFILFVFLTAISTFSQNNWKKVNEKMSVLNTQYSGVYKAKISYDGTQIFFFTNSGYLIKINTETGQEISNTFIVSDFRDVDFTPDAEYFVYISNYNPNILRDSNKVIIMNLINNTQKSITYFTDRELFGGPQTSQTPEYQRDKVYISDNKDFIFATWLNGRINNYTDTGTDKFIHFRFFNINGNILQYNLSLTGLYDVSSKKGFSGFIFSGVDGYSRLWNYSRTTETNSYVNSFDASGILHLHSSHYYYNYNHDIGKVETTVDANHKYFYQIHMKNNSIFNCYYKDKDENKYLGISESNINNSQNIDLDIVGWNYFDDNGYTLKLKGTNLSISTILFDKDIILTPNIYPFTYTINCSFAYEDKIFLFCNDGYLRVINNGNVSSPYCEIIASNKNPRVGDTVNFEAVYSSHFTNSYFSMDGFGQNTKKVSHAFSKEGKYNVKLVCKNDTLEKNREMEINVISNLIPDFEIVGGSEQFVGDTITLINKSQGNNYNFYYSSEEATVVSQTPYKIYYIDPGLKSITLTIFDNYGSKSISKDVVLKNRPIVIKEIDKYKEIIGIENNAYFNFLFTNKDEDYFYNNQSQQFFLKYDTKLDTLQPITMPFINVNAVPYNDGFIYPYYSGNNLQFYFIKNSGEEKLIYTVKSGYNSPDYKTSKLFVNEDYLYAVFSLSNSNYIFSKYDLKNNKPIYDTIPSNIIFNSFLKSKNGIYCIVSNSRNLSLFKFGENSFEFVKNIYSFGTPNFTVNYISCDNINEGNIIDIEYYIKDSHSSTLLLSMDNEFNISTKNYDYQYVKIVPLISDLTFTMIRGLKNWEISLMDKNFNFLGTKTILNRDLDIKGLHINNNLIFIYGSYISPNYSKYPYLLAIKEFSLTGMVNHDINLFYSTDFIYPNPADDEIFFKDNLNCKLLNVTDVFGNNVINLENVFDLKSLNISKIPIGLYFLTIYNDNESKTFKFVKIK